MHPDTAVDRHLPRAPRTRAPHPLQASSMNGEWNLPARRTKAGTATPFRNRSSDNEASGVVCDCFPILHDPSKIVDRRGLNQTILTKPAVRVMVGARPKSTQGNRSSASRTPPIASLAARRVFDARKKPPRCSSWRVSRSSSEYLRVWCCDPVQMQAVHSSRCLL